MEERKAHPVMPTKINKDDIMAVVYYVKVGDVRSGGSEIAVKDLDHDTDFFVKGHDLIARCLSADQHQEETQVSKTEAAEILVSAYNRPFTVCFEKTDGTERVLRGRLVRPEPLLGRSMVEDLDEVKSERIRQVDHRTIHWLIIEGVKYVVKKRGK